MYSILMSLIPIVLYLLAGHTIKPAITTVRFMSVVLSLVLVAFSSKLKVQLHNIELSVTL